MSPSLITQLIFYGLLLSLITYVILIVLYITECWLISPCLSTYYSSGKTSILDKPKFPVPTSMFKQS